MRFKLDENLPVEAAEILISAGHDALTVNQQDMQGSPDDLLMKVCKNEKRAIITLDTDFSDIRKYPPKDLQGIIVLRIFNQSKNNVISIIRKLIPKLKLEKVEGSLWIVEEEKVRIR